MWIIKTDALGNKLWDKTIFNTGHDETGYAVQVSDSCYVFANFTPAGMGGYKTQPNHDLSLATNDYWIIKFCEQSVPLPVELTNFSVFVLGNVIRVDWTTACEINNSYFNVERSADGNNFETILMIDGAGNNTSVINYSFTDKNPFNGISYYRIKQTDFNGQCTWSKILSAKFKNEDQYLTIYPNPPQNILTLQLPEGNIFEVIITNIFGTQVFDERNIETQKKLTVIIFQTEFIL